MAKMQPLEIPSDDFELEFDGVVYRLHEGESVRLFPSITAGDNKLTHQLMQAQAELEAVKGDEDERQKTVEFVDQINTQICLKLAKRVKSWTWTDEDGTPLPQPDGTAAVFLSLRQEELMYLWGKSLSRESPAAAKKD